MCGEVCSDCGDEYCDCECDALCEEDGCESRDTVCCECCDRVLCPKHYGTEEGYCESCVDATCVVCEKPFARRDMTSLPTGWYCGTCEPQCKRAFRTNDMNVHGVAAVATKLEMKALKDDLKGLQEAVDGLRSTMGGLIASSSANQERLDALARCVREWSQPRTPNPKGEAVEFCKCCGEAPNECVCE